MDIELQLTVFVLQDWCVERGHRDLSPYAGAAAVAAGRELVQGSGDTEGSGDY